MAKPMIRLTTTREAEGRLAEPRPPLVVNIIYKNGRYCLDAFGRYWTLPARWDRLWRWLRGRRVWALALALLALAGATWALWRILFGAQR
jgi:hypothetical protein